MKEEVLKIFVEEFKMPKDLMEKFLDSLGDISNLDRLRQASEKLLIETVLDDSEKQKSQMKAL